MLRDVVSEPLDPETDRQHRRVRELLVGRLFPQLENIRVDVSGGNDFPFTGKDVLQELSRDGILLGESHMLNMTRQ